MARIAEDEARVEGFWAGDPGATPDFYWGIDRIRAECAAKRRIVELHKIAPWRLSRVGYVTGRDGRRWDQHYTGGCCDLCTAGGEYGGAVSEFGREEDYDYCDNASRARLGLRGPPRL